MKSEGLRPAIVRPSWLRAVGSLRVTLVIFVLLAAGVIIALQNPGATTWAMVFPLTLCGINLAAAIVVHPAFRRQAGLLVFHLALLAIVVLAALGRLTYLKGSVELSTGEPFLGQLTAFEAGPWHPWGIRQVRFENEGFTIDYLPGRKRDHTFNQITYRDDEGALQRVTIGDQVPLLLGGYRFYTSFNKGFALTFLWTPAQGKPRRGTVHLPGYPIHEYRQANTWTPPGTATEIWTQLQFDEPLLDPNGPAKFRTPGSHKVVIRTETLRKELVPGQGMDISGGRLTYEGVGTWMGYKVFYDPTLPWLLAACVAAVASLGWHFWRSTAARPWQRNQADGEEVG